MNGLAVVIKELQEATAELQESNDYAQFLADERAMLDRNIEINAHTFRRAPRLCTDLINDRLAIFCGEERTV